MMTVIAQNLRKMDSFPFPRRTSRVSRCEVSLLTRIRAGDERAFKSLVEQYSSRLLAVAGRLLSSEEDRADAVQDTFLAVFKSIEFFQCKSSLWTWLYRIIVNICLRKRHNRSRRREVSWGDTFSDLPEIGHSPYVAREGAEPAYTRLARIETRKQVRICINRLPVSYRTVVLLRDIEELDTDQTARLLCISEKAVRVRLHRAHRALRALLRCQEASGNKPWRDQV